MEKLWKQWDRLRACRASAHCAIECVREEQQNRKRGEIDCRSEQIEKSLIDRIKRKEGFLGEMRGRNDKTASCALNRKKGPGLPFFVDYHFEFRGDSVNELHRDRSFADCFDRIVELDTALVDLKALRLQRIGEVGGRD